MPPPDDAPPKPKRRRRWLYYLAGLLLLGAVLVVGAWKMMIDMPGESYRGPLPELTARQSELSRALRRHVQKLAGEIGQRNVPHHAAYQSAARYIEQTLRGAGHEVSRQEYEVDGRTCANLECEIPGGDLPAEIVVIGAHYDSVYGSPGANDNASGVAAVLALARILAKDKPARTLRFVLFANEEPPYFQRHTMGSLVYARRCRSRGENIVAMLSIETIGYFDDSQESQQYPAPLDLAYPSEGNFIGVIGNIASRELVRKIVGAFRGAAQFPCEGGALPEAIDGVGWSDHWSFWQEDYAAAMITDTAPFRYPYYHTPQDTPDKLDYQRMARVVEGMAPVIRLLAGSDLVAPDR